MQSGHFGSKIKNAKKHAKNISKRHCSCSMQKRAPKTADIPKMRAFWKLAKMATKQRLKPLQNGHFGSKVKNAKKHGENGFYSSMQKTAPKNS